MTKLASEAFTSPKEEQARMLQWRRRVDQNKICHWFFLLLLLRVEINNRNSQGDSAQRAAILSNVVDWALCWKIARS